MACPALQVRKLLDQLEPINQWEQKVLDPVRCGLVKAVCRHEQGVPFEWVAPKWKGPFEKHGRKLLEMSPAEREQLLSSPPTSAPGNEMVMRW